MKEIYNGVFNSDDGDNIYVMGDMHGDYQCLIHCLVDLCKVAKVDKIYDDQEFKTDNREYISWEKNNNSVIVFCGDMIHRKRFATVLDDECSDVYILQTVIRLKKEAKKNGGDILIISGNHEIMNIIYPEDTSYVSKKNIDINNKYFNDTKFINEYISNSYAFIKIDNSLIAHGGLCSDYLNCLDKFVVDNIKSDNIISKHRQERNKKYYKINNNSDSKTIDEHILIGGSKLEYGDQIIDFINNKYKTFFTNIDRNNLDKDKISYELFINYNINNKKEHNIFWCRQWGYNSDCGEMAKILTKVKCTKMIIAHCPQFLSPNEPKMINFECKISKEGEEDDYTLARVDLGMSRSFDENSDKNFLNYLFYNYNRKMSVLKVVSNEGNLCFNYNSVITKKLSCIQYLLIKYGIEKKNWLKNGICSNWKGFDYVDEIINTIKNNKNNKTIQKTCTNSQNKHNKRNNADANSFICLLYPVIFNNKKIISIIQFNDIKKN
jgi:hypothetical protein